MQNYLILFQKKYRSTFLEPEKLKKQGFVGNRERETVQNWTSCWSCRFQMKPCCESFSKWNEKVFDMRSERVETERYNSVCNWQYKNKLFRTLFSRNQLKFENLPNRDLKMSKIWASAACCGRVMENFPVSVANETLFFELFRFQKGGPTLFLELYQLFASLLTRCR